MLAVPLTDYYEEVRRYLTCPSDGPKRRSA